MQMTKELLHEQENVIIKEYVINFQPRYVFDEAGTVQDRKND